MLHQNAYIIQQIRQLIPQIFGCQVRETQQLQDSASNRRHYRIYCTNGKSYIATYHAEEFERRRFLQLSQFFAEYKLPAPKIYYSAPDSPLFIQEDLGAHNLLEKFTQNGYSANVAKIYAQTVQTLAKAQILTHKNLDYSQVLQESSELKTAWINNDLWACKHYLFDKLRIQVNMQDLEQEFNQLRAEITQICQENPELVSFVFRDFQARNILTRASSQGEEIVFIDYQSGFAGPGIYDLATLLFQVRIGLNSAQRQYLYELYVEEYERQTQIKTAPQTLKKLFLNCVFLRYLQLLSAYGNRGLSEGKSYFARNLELVQRAIAEFLQDNCQYQTTYPYLSALLLSLPKEPVYCELVRSILPVNSPCLQVLVQSFSYKRGLPTDYSGHGGGFVWDCRLLENPGRQEMYKGLSGLDLELQNYFAEAEDMQDFLLRVWAEVKPCIEVYLARKFSYVSLAFGCTGGQHRSVYVANWIYTKLQEEYAHKLQVFCKHRESLSD